MLFSATMPKQLVQFSRAGLRDPQFIRLDAEATLSSELRIGMSVSASVSGMHACATVCQYIATL